ncbi:hypothetical protein MPLSOD_20145 [Mesorhizobium sp. SOD10]|nr:hypothetical protein MPLSOD_20145 [Mesorhizobium sp. SOD10]
MLLIVDAGVSQASLDLLEKADARGVIFEDSFHHNSVGVTGRCLV